MKENKMGRACSTHGRGDKEIQRNKILMEETTMETYA
jgi:hypothetical protein